MSVYVNPFLARASEHQRDVRQFVNTFGPGAVDLLPDAVWDRLVVLRSTPGAGKTSLMRLFTTESLEWISRNLKQSDALYKQLLDREVLSPPDSLKIGALVSLDRGYRSLLDLPVDQEHARKLFLRLLDVRILIAVMKSCLRLRGMRFPQDARQFALNLRESDPSADAIVERLGGPDGDRIVQYARSTEKSILAMLDALIPDESFEEIEGHSDLYSLKVLDLGMKVGGVPMRGQPLLLFDDGHELHRTQRDSLLHQLSHRSQTVARWYAERFEALSNQEILSEIGREGRDHVLVDLDDIARHGSSDGRRFQRGRYDRVLADIARRRAEPALLTYAQEQQDFFSLLDEERNSYVTDRQEILGTLQARVVAIASGEPRYDSWLKDARELSGWEAAVRWRELEILISRDRDRQQDLFEEPLGVSDIDERSNPAIREGAALAIAREFGVPYYAGTATIIKLGSHNAEQFLNLCGDLFAEMLIDVSLGRQPRLDARRQHRIIREGSERFWNSIPRNVPNGRDVQGLVNEIIAIAHAENSKPKLPYPPGVTGTALLMGERGKLLDPEYRRRTPGAERLFAALASAVAHNVLTAELDYSVKNDRFMVLYLNRLLCPRFWLPLGYGSFRERRLHVMLEWMRKLPSTGASFAIEEPLPL